jgi:hypothetical protein
MVTMSGFMHLLPIPLTCQSGVDTNNYTFLKIDLLNSERERGCKIKKIKYI